MEDERSEAPESTATATEQEQPAGDAAQLQKERDDFYDRLLRKTAEFDNYRKRTDRERLQLSEAAAPDLLPELLPLGDDMERALKADTGGDGGDAVRKGVELFHKQLLEVLRKRGVKPIGALGADFDPHF